MKLYEVFIENNLDYDDYQSEQKLIVAESLSKATEVAEAFLKNKFSPNNPLYYDEQPSYCVEEVSLVDGYPILVGKIDSNQ